MCEIGDGRIKIIFCLALILLPELYATDSQECVRHENVNDVQDIMKIYSCRVGDNVELDCPYTSRRDEHLTVQWLHNTLPVLTIKDGEFSVTAQVNDIYSRGKARNRILNIGMRKNRWTFYYNGLANTFSHRISDVRSTDDGLWECRVISGDTLRSEVIIKVVSPESETMPQSLSSSGKDDTYMVNYGAETTSQTSGQPVSSSKKLNLNFLLILAMLCFCLWSVI